MKLKMASGKLVAKKGVKIFILCGFAEIQVCFGIAKVVWTKNGKPEAKRSLRKVFSKDQGILNPNFIKHALSSVSDQRR